MRAGGNGSRMRILLACAAVAGIAAATACGDRQPHRPDVPILLSMDAAVSASADLWLVEPDGRLRNLTKSRDDEYTPSWSPDGTRIVYVRQYATGDRIGGDDLFLLDVASRRSRPLVVSEYEEAFPAWSPTGERIAFVSDHEFVLGAIYTIRPDGRGRRLVGARGRMPASLTWSPAGDRIAFTTNVGPGDDLRVHVVDADGGVARPVSAGPIDREPVWSPRGNEILFIRGFEVRAVDADTREERSLHASGVAAGWFGEDAVVVADPGALAIIGADGDRRIVTRLRGLIYAPPAARPVRATR